VTEISRDPASQRFERVRLQRWQQVAQSIGLSWPVKSPQITSKFGVRSGDPHDGVDLRAPVGTPVLASHDGRVLYSGSGISGYGRLVVLRHPSGIATVYAHNSSLKVRKGQWVRRGQLIARSGATGRASGPHVHFEVRAGSRPLNPKDLIKDRSSRRGALAALD
jgi:murein DD-endopeptidase MepM/ murein hydrolase activator NlpD